MASHSQLHEQRRRAQTPSCRGCAHSCAGVTYAFVRRANAFVRNARAHPLILRIGVGPLATPGVYEHSAIVLM
jgi:hypothetical protein